MSENPVPGRAVRGRAVAVRALLICGAWAAVGVTGLFGVWIARSGGPATMLQMAPLVVAVGLTVAMVVAQSRARGPRWIPGTLALSAVAGVAVLAVDWEAASIRLFYRLQRDDFAAVAALDATGPIRETLPPSLDHLSIKGSATRLGADATVLFLPVWARYPDRPGGYAYVRDAKPAEAYDCYGDTCEMRFRVGDGWYWFERDTPEWAR